MPIASNRDTLMNADINKSMLGQHMEKVSSLHAPNSAQTL